jgi:hypothetical protein
MCIHIHAHAQANAHAHTQTGGRARTHTDRQTDRQTYVHACTHAQCAQISPAVCVCVCARAQTHTNLQIGHEGAAGLKLLLLPPPPLDVELADLPHAYEHAGSRDAEDDARGNRRGDADEALCPDRCEPAGRRTVLLGLGHRVGLVACARGALLPVILAHDRLRADARHE